jgi:hypothetical protein
MTLRRTVLSYHPVQRRDYQIIDRPLSLELHNEPFLLMSRARSERTQDDDNKDGG